MTKKYLIDESVLKQTVDALYLGMGKLKNDDFAAYQSLYKALQDLHTATTSPDLVTHEVCSECETVAHCRVHGCIPKQAASVQPPCTICGATDHKETCDSPGAIITRSTGCPAHDQTVASPAAPAQNEAWTAKQKALADEAVKCATEAMSDPNNQATKAVREYYEANTRPAPLQEADTYGYAKQIAVAIWEKHYKTTAPKWEPCAELMAVLTQIDNMVASLERQPEQPAVQKYVVNKWRDLALQFDAHRMKALALLQALAQDPAKHIDVARDFLSAPPPAQIKAEVDDFQVAPIFEKWVQARSEYPSIKNGDSHENNQAFVKALTRFHELMTKS